MPRDRVEEMTRLVRKLEARLSLLQDRLVAAHQAKAEFLAYVSREMVDPLDRVLDVVGLLLEGEAGDLAEEQRRYLDDAAEKTRTLRSTVDRIVALTGSGTEGSLFLPEELSIAEVIEGVVRRLRKDGAGAGIVLAASAAARIMADPAKLSFIVEELVTNSLRFSPPGSRVSVATRERTGEGGAPGLVEIVVTDQGRGIRPEDAERIFGAFETAEAGEDSAGGAGLGLALVKRFVELHGGKIWVDSRPGEGSAFTVVLPAAGPLHQKSPPPRIILANTDVAFVQLLSQSLHEEGYDVTLFPSALDVLDRGTRFPPDLFIVDASLPDIPGIELCLRLKSHAATRHIPVIIVASFPDPAIALQSARTGAEAFYVKPIDLREILARIRRLVAQKLTHDALLRKYEIAAAQAFTDQATGLYNQRYLWTILERELERARRYSHPCSVAMIDIDWFKQYNDSYGHLRGDAILGETALLLKRKIRNSDTAVRYGGEEFVVVMPETGKRLAALAGEKLRAAFEKHRFPMEETQPGGGLTVSVGVATFPGEGETPRELVDRADRHLYRAKELGRNRVVSE
jgi:diguanylate cyclase (GGDEF)-like protein